MITNTTHKNKIININIENKKNISESSKREEIIYDINNDNYDPRKLLYSPKSEELGVLKSNVKISDLFSNKKINPDVFFIRMCWYRANNPAWAKKMCDCALETSEIMGLEDFETIIKNIENNVNKINKNVRFGDKRSFGFSSFVIRQDSRGEEYFDKYKERLNSQRLESLKITPPEKYKNANTVEIFASNDSVSIRYGHTNSDKSNLCYVQEVYEELINTKNPSLETILEKTATMRWLFNQEQPYYRGSESVMAILERAIFHHYKITSTPYKKGTSPDFEAFYRNMDDFIKVYPTLFEQRPEFKQ